MPKVKDKDRILKAAREKQRVTYKQVPTGLSADFSKETAGRKGLARCIQSDEKQGTYLGCRPDARWGTHERQPHKVMKSKDLQLWLLYPAKLSFRMEEQIKCFPDKVKLKEFIIIKSLLHEMLKGLIQEEEEDQNYEHWKGKKLTTINNWN